MSMIRKRLEALEARSPQPTPPAKPVDHKALLRDLQQIEVEATKRRLVDARYRERTPIPEQLEDAKREEVKAIKAHEEAMGRPLPDTKKPEYWAAWSALRSADGHFRQATWWRQQVEYAAKGEPSYWWKVYADNDRELIRRADGWKRRPGPALCTSCRHWNAPADKKPSCVNRMEFAGDRDECYTYQQGGYGTIPGAT